MKISKILILLLLILFSINSLKASCPSGYQEQTVSFTVNSNCTIKIKFCYYCSSVGVGFDIIKQEYTIPDECLDYVASHPQEVKNEADIAILNYLMTVNGCIKPCNYPNWQLHIAVISELECKKFRLDLLLQEVQLLNCEGSGTCIKYYKVCVSIVNGIPTLTYLPDCTEEIPGDECPLTIPPDIPENAPDGWTSECFLWGNCGF
jgi:hypothetical protein